MTALRTPVDIANPPWMTNYRMKHLFIGSCFTENIGGRMAELKFNTDINPFGILFNPESISQCIRRLLSPELFTEDDLFFHDGLWHSYRHHGRFSSLSPAISLREINTRLLFSSGYLKQADFLFLTFGTAWVYELKSNGMIVSNCHKVPAGEFKRFRLSVSEMVISLRETLDDLWKFNPGIKVIMTVSPVRHLKDGAPENQLGKAALLLTVDALLNGFGGDRIYYFPSYELVMDELRDYRFYAEDMVHLSTVAVNYIWEKFSEVFLDPECKEMSAQILSVVRNRNHKPLNRISPEYSAFRKKCLLQILDITEKHPYIDFSEEKEYFAKELNL